MPNHRASISFPTINPCPRPPTPLPSASLRARRPLPHPLLLRLSAPHSPSPSSGRLPNFCDPPPPDLHPLYRASSPAPPSPLPPIPNFASPPISSSSTLLRPHTTILSLCFHHRSTTLKPMQHPFFPLPIASASLWSHPSPPFPTAPASTPPTSTPHHLSPPPPATSTALTITIKDPTFAPTVNLRLLSPPIPIAHFAIFSDDPTSSLLSPPSLLFPTTAGLLIIAAVNPDPQISFESPLLLPLHRNSLILATRRPTHY